MLAMTYQSPINRSKFTVVAVRMGGGLLQATSVSSTTGMKNDGITDDMVSSLEHIPKGIALLRGGVERDPSAAQGVPEVDRELVRDDAAVCGSCRDSLHG